MSARKNRLSAATANTKRAAGIAFMIVLTPTVGMEKKTCLNLLLFAIDIIPTWYVGKEQQVQGEQKSQVFHVSKVTRYAFSMHNV